MKNFNIPLYLFLSCIVITEMTQPIVGTWRRNVIYPETEQEKMAQKNYADDGNIVIQSIDRSSFRPLDSEVEIQRLAYIPTTPEFQSHHTNYIPIYPEVKIQSVDASQEQPVTEETPNDQIPSEEEFDFAANENQDFGATTDVMPVEDQVDPISSMESVQAEPILLQASQSTPAALESSEAVAAADTIQIQPEEINEDLAPVSTDNPVIPVLPMEPIQANPMLLQTSEDAPAALESSEVADTTQIQPEEISEDLAPILTETEKAQEIMEEPVAVSQEVKELMQEDAARNEQAKDMDTQEQSEDKALDLSSKPTTTEQAQETTLKPMAEEKTPASVVTEPVVKEKENEQAPVVDESPAKTSSEPAMTKATAQPATESAQQINPEKEDTAEIVYVYPVYDTIRYTITSVASIIKNAYNYVQSWLA